MFADPVFYLAAIPAVLITGIAKGGFGGIALMAVPLMSLVMSPVQAAGIMLPILIVMDAVGLWAFRKDFDPTHLTYLVPAATLGVLLGYLSVGWMSDDLIRIIVALIAAWFLISAFMRRGQATQKNGPPTPATAGLWGSVAGYTSFIAHAGGPPFQVYLIPKGLEPRAFAATAVFFFTIVNLIKLPPYLITGQISMTNFWLSATLFPIAPVGVALGVYLNGRVPRDVFFNLLYIGLGAVSLKLGYDGISGLLAQ